MSGLGTRIKANLVWLVLFSLAVTVGAFLSFISGVLFDDSYPVTVAFPEAGGAFPGQFVTVKGVQVGVIEDVSITDTGVDFKLKINGGAKVPKQPETARVLRQSPIGEQAVDLQPGEAPWTPAEEGDRLQPKETQVPESVPKLLENSARLFAAMEVEDVAIVVDELAEALEGNGPRLRQLNRDSLELQQTLVDGIPQLERSINTQAPILDTLRAHRQALAESFTHAADFNETLANLRPTASELLDTAPPALGQLNAFIRNTRPNWQCFNRDLIALNEMILGPSTGTGAVADNYSSKLDELEKALQRNRRFFQEGFGIFVQPDPTNGVLWNRVQFLDPSTAQGEAYAQRRPTPPTRPGAACQSDFGLGVNAVRQEDPQPPRPTSPGIDYAPLVDGRSPNVGPNFEEQQATQDAEQGVNTEGPDFENRSPTDGVSAVPRDDSLPEGEDEGRGLLGWLAIIIPVLAIGGALFWRRRS